MAITYGSGFHQQFSAERAFVAFLGALFCIFMCTDRHIGIKSAVLEQLSCYALSQVFYCGAKAQETYSIRPLGLRLHADEVWGS